MTSRRIVVAAILGLVCGHALAAAAHSLDRSASDAFPPGDVGRTLTHAGGGVSDLARLTTNYVLAATPVCLVHAVR